MGLSDRTILDILVLVCFILAFPISLWVLIKHGAGRQAGWLYVSIVCVIRIVGAATGIAADSDDSQDLIEASTICYGIAVSPILLALLGIVKRANDGMGNQGLNAKVLQFANLPILVALILGVVGGTKLYSTNSSAIADGQKFVEASSIIYLLVWIGLTGVCALTCSKLRYVLDGERRLATATLISTPFILVRVIYSILTAFNHSSTVFSLVSDRVAAIIVQAVMSVGMELLVITVFLIAGFSVNRKLRGTVDKEASVVPPQYSH